jgi:proteic killer suppression protein
MIVSFGDRGTEALYHGLQRKQVRRIPVNIRTAALRKLDMLNAAHKLDDLASIPGNRLEVLRGRLSGFHSIRINDQWRIVFRWAGADAHHVQIVDYH